MILGHKNKYIDGNVDEFAKVDIDVMILRDMNTCAQNVEQLLLCSDDSFCPRDVGCMNVLKPAALGLIAEHNGFGVRLLALQPQGEVRPDQIFGEYIGEYTTYDVSQHEDYV